MVADDTHVAFVTGFNRVGVLCSDTLAQTTAFDVPVPGPPRPAESTLTEVSAELLVRGMLYVVCERSHDVAYAIEVWDALNASRVRVLQCPSAPLWTARSLATNGRDLFVGFNTDARRVQEATGGPIKVWALEDGAR